jgi:DNA-binding response OmpR family regulator
MATATSPKVVRVGAADDALMRALVEHRVPSAGWRVEALDGPVEGNALVILDFDDGEAQRRAVDAMRAQGFAGRILILGHRDAAATANDEPIPRPVRLGTLLNRIDAYWAQAEEAAFARLGPYRFLPDESVLKPDGDEAAVRLTELECKLLTYLTEARGALVGREQLLAAVWGYSAAIDTHTVETHIWRLRQKIETDDPATRFLVTEPGGYRLISGDVPDDGRPDA